MGGGGDGGGGDGVPGGKEGSGGGTGGRGGGEYASNSHACILGMRAPAWRDAPASVHESTLSVSPLVVMAHRKPTTSECGSTTFRSLQSQMTWAGDAGRASASPEPTICGAPKLTATSRTRASTVEYGGVASTMVTVCPRASVLRRPRASPGWPQPTSLPARSNAITSTRKAPPSRSVRSFSRTSFSPAAHGTVTLGITGGGGGGGGGVKV